jgi:hypothetical protein
MFHELYHICDRKAPPDKEEEDPCAEARAYAAMKMIHETHEKHKKIKKICVICVICGSYFSYVSGRRLAIMTSCCCDLRL